MCFVLGFGFLVLSLLYIPVLPLFSPLGWFLLSSDHPLVDLLVPVVSCIFVFGGFLSVLLVHIVTRSPLLVYIGGLIVYVVTSCIILEAGLSIIPVVLSGIIMFLWS